MPEIVHLRPRPPQGGDQPQLLAAASGSPRPVPPSRLRGYSGAAVRLTPVSPATGQPRPDGAEDSTHTADLEARISGIARSVTQGALEVIGGTRPLQQMARWLDEHSYERLQFRANLVRSMSSQVPTGSTRGECTATPAARLHRTVCVRPPRVCHIDDSTFEVALTVFDQRRVRAVALRLERWRERWRVTALEIG